MDSAPEPYSPQLRAVLQDLNREVRQFDIRLVEANLTDDAESSAQRTEIARLHTRLHRLEEELGQGRGWLIHLADRTTALEEATQTLAIKVRSLDLVLTMAAPEAFSGDAPALPSSMVATDILLAVADSDAEEAFEPRSKLRRASSGDQSWYFDFSDFAAAIHPTSTQSVCYFEGTLLAPSIVPVQQSIPQSFPAAKALPHFQDASAYAAYPTLQQTPVQASISLATPRPVQSSPAALRAPSELHPPALRAPAAGMMTSKDNHQACDERNRVLFDQLCKSHGAYSSVLQQLESSREGALIRSRLLNKVSDTTAARYLRSVQLFFCAFEELGGNMEAIDPGLFLDAFFALSPGADSGPLSNSINVLKALRWYKKLLAIACLPDLYGTAFSLLSNPAGQEKRESIPLPLSFVAFLERMLLSGKASLMDGIWAGSFLVAIGASLRFADAQHVRWSTLCVSSFTLRGICYRTKTTEGGCPWGLLSFGLFSSSEDWGMTWLPHWLGALDTVWCEVRSRFGPQPEPDCLFFLWSETGFAPASYSQALQKLRYMLTLSGIAPAQAAQYTLHSLKTTFLSWMSQLSIPLSSRFLQGHHKAPGSAQLYSRDDVWPALRAQWLLWRSIHAGFRPARPQHRGGQSPLVEPLVDTAGFQWVEYCPDLSCFSVGNDCQSFLALEQQDGDLRDVDHFEDSDADETGTLLAQYDATPLVDASQNFHLLSIFRPTPAYVSGENPLSEAVGERPAASLIHDELILGFTCSGANCFTVPSGQSCTRFCDSGEGTAATAALFTKGEFSNPCSAPAAPTPNAPPAAKEKAPPPPLAETGATDGSAGTTSQPTPASTTPTPASTTATATPSGNRAPLLASEAPASRLGHTIYDSEGQPTLQLGYEEWGQNQSGWEDQPAWGSWNWSGRNWQHQCQAKMSDFTQLVADCNVPAAVSSLLSAFDVALFARSCTTSAELEELVNHFVAEASVTDAAERFITKASLRLLFCKCRTSEGMASLEAAPTPTTPLGDGPPAATPAPPATPPLSSSWQEAWPAKLSGERTASLRKRFERAFQAPAYWDKEVRWIPWKYRLSARAQEDRLLVRPRKQARFDLTELFLDEAPTRDIYMKAPLPLALICFTKYDAAASLRGPTTMEAQAADRRCWEIIADLVNVHHWKLDDALHEVAEVRSDMHSLLAPRPFISKPKFDLDNSWKARFTGNGRGGKGGGRGGKGRDGKGEKGERFERGGKGGKGKDNKQATPPGKWLSTLFMDGKRQTLCMRYQSGQCKETYFSELRDIAEEARAPVSDAASALSEGSLDFATCLESGIFQRTEQFSDVLRFLNAFMQLQFPEASWSSLCVSHNVRTRLHTDSGNAAGSLNHTASLGNFSGGEVWLCPALNQAASQVPAPLDASSEAHSAAEAGTGEVRVTWHAPLSFTCEALHCTLPIQGDRWVLTAYTCKSLDRFDATPPAVNTSSLKDTTCVELFLDICCGEQLDLLNDGTYDHLLRLCFAGIVRLAHGSPPCKEYSRLKLRPGGPPAIRSPDHMNGAHVSLEQPTNAMSWLEPFVQDMLSEIQASLVNIPACAVGGHQSVAGARDEHGSALIFFSKTCLFGCALYQSDSLHDLRKDWNFSVTEGQPYCLSALERLSTMLGDKDTSLFPALQKGAGCYTLPELKRLKLLGLLQWILHGLPALRIHSYLDDKLRFTGCPPGTGISPGSILLSARHKPLKSKDDLALVPVSTKRMWLRVTDPTSSKRRLSESSRETLAFFAHLSSRDWRPRPLRPPPTSSVESAADAFGKGNDCGVGGWLLLPGGRLLWFAHRYTVKDFLDLGLPMQADANLDISSYETLAQCFVLLAFWKAHGSGRLALALPALSDNSGAESVCNKLYTSKVPLNLFVRKLSMWSSITGVALDCSHIAGEKNDDADLLSRWDGSAELPAKFLASNRIELSLSEFWQIRFQVTLFPADTFLKWQLPSADSLGPTNRGSRKRK
ncbi:unnamed protein product [Symbiodinium sp. CCMP2592]|nr:unnamed protein product [Symbiodinium sp. CCMP2592]